MIRYPKILFSTLAYMCCFSSPGQAQGQYMGIDRPQKYFKLDFSLGGNIDLIGSPSGQDVSILSSRPTTVPSFGLRTIYLFSPKVGAYAGFRLNFFKERKFDFYKPGLFEEIFTAFFEGFFRPILISHPSIDAGLVYRIERRRWNMYPAIGIGYAQYVNTRSRSTSRTDGNGVRNDFHYEQKASSTTFNVGVSINHFLTRRGYLILNAGFQQPLQASYASFSQSQNDVEIAHVTYRNPTAGRAVMLDVGYGFIVPKK